MEDNIYQAPKADLSTHEQKKGSPVKAVLIAATVDILGSLLMGIILGFIYSIILIVNGTPPEAVSNKLSHLSSDSALSSLGNVLGLMISVYTGYLCAKIANHREYKIAGILGAILVLFGILISATHYSAIKNILLNILTLMCVYLGAWLHVRNKRKYSAPN